MKYTAQIFIGGEVYTEVATNDTNEAKLRSKYPDMEKVIFEPSKTLLDLVLATKSYYVSSVDENGEFFVQYNEPIIDEQTVLKIIAIANVFGFTIRIGKAVYLTFYFKNKK